MGMAYLGGLGTQELLHVLDAKVADANVAHLARVEQLLHLAPRVDKVPVAVRRLAAGGGVEAAGPVDQVQVDVVGLQGGQRVGQGLGHALVVGVVELGGQPDVGAGDARGAQAGADLGLVAVGGGRVEVAVAAAQGGLDGGLDLVGLGLPGAQADGGDLGARVEGVGFAGGGVSSCPGKERG